MPWKWLSLSTGSFSSIPEPGELIGPWRVLREAGRGGMALILEVEHIESGIRRAVKMMLPTARPDEVAKRFRGEFRALSRLSHPGVLRVYEVGVYQDRPYFVMELLEGQELRVEVEGWVELAPTERYRRAERVLIQVARALEYIHGRGLVHRDITPSNIMMLPDGTAKLMDFGVVKEPGGDLTLQGEVVGTVAYIAPEQIMGEAVDARADLYSLGAVFYLMLTGRRPFNARSLSGYLEKHLNRPVRPPRELLPTLPERLNDVCVRLLAKDPADRFASATHLLHVLEAGGGERLETEAGAVWAPRLAGRTAELAAVRAAVGRLARGVGGVLLIEGEPGMGKTQLAEEALTSARQHGLSVSRANNSSPSQPAFLGFRPLLDDLLQESGRAPSAVLEAAFLRPLREGETVERLAVCAAFKDLVPADNPRLVLLDDVGRADAGTLELLTYLSRALLKMGGAPLLFVLTRLPPHGADPLAELREAAGGSFSEVHLGPLTPSAVEDLMLGLVRDTPAARILASRLHREGEGSPYNIGEMVRALAVSGVLVPGEDGGRGSLVLDEAEVTRAVLPVPPNQRDALLARLGPMSEDARRVAEVLAVARHELGLGLVMSAAQQEEERALQSLDELIEALAARERRVGGTERFELAQNRLRDVLLAETPTDRLVGVHRRLAEALEQQHRREIPSVVEELAWHFEKGLVPAKAFPYLVAAAEELMSRGFVVEALDYLDRALVSEHQARQFVTLDEADRRLARLLLRRATALYHLGRWDDAGREAGRADALARQVGDAVLLAGINTELGRIARRRHDLDAAERHLGLAREHARAARDRQLEILPVYEHGGLLWARGDLEGARRCWVEVLALAESCSDDRSLAMGYNGLALLALCKGHVSEARDHLSKAIALCERHGLVEQLGICRNNLVEVYHLTGHLQRGLALAETTVTQAREMGHRYGIGLGLFVRALMLTDLGRLAEAEDNAREALLVHRALDNHEDALSSLILLVRVALERSRLVEAAALLDECQQLMDRYDAEGYAPLIFAWKACVLAEQGSDAEARAALSAAQREPGRTWPHQQVRLGLSVSRAWRLLGEREMSFAEALAALELSERCGFKYYVLLARLFAARTAPDAEQAARHESLARAMARSLAAGLPRADSDRFVEQFTSQPGSSREVVASILSRINESNMK